MPQLKDIYSILGISANTYYNLLHAELLPPPSHGDGRRKHYSDEDVQQLKEKVAAGMREMQRRRLAAKLEELSE
jgi:hypothetical protein